jgi:tryptophan halogenase
VSAEGAIRDIVVAGGGITGWSAAAALKRRLPNVKVLLVNMLPPPDALADRIGTTLPSIGGFHGDVGLSEADTVARAGSAFRLGTLFEGWSEGAPGYVHAYGVHGQAFGTTSFHHQWVRAAKAGKAAPFDAFSPGAAMGKAGRFLHPRGEPGSPLASFEYGLQINVLRYAELMRAFARHLGVEEKTGDIVEVALRGGDGFVEALKLGDGSEVRGDLFVDCTGPRALVRSKLDDAFIDWNQWLLCDRVTFGEAPAMPDLPVLDRVEATPNGWRWQAASPLNTAVGMVFSSVAGGVAGGQKSGCGGVETSGGGYAGAGETLPEGVPIRQGRRPQPWLRNCVAIGDSAVAVEPLEWTNLHLAHSFIDRMVWMMPGRDCAPVELAEYNRQSEAEADRVRDFLVLHYVTSNRPEPFWREAAAVTPPDSLAHTLTLFQERGRLPFYEEETFTRDSWLSVLIGQGVMPRRTDPLTDTIPAAEAEQRMDLMRQTLDEMVDQLPPHAAYLQNFAQRALGRR